MSKNEPDEPTSEGEDSGDENAYEDAWYRSLKARSERPETRSDEETGSVED